MIRNLAALSALLLSSSLHAGIISFGIGYGIGSSGKGSSAPPPNATVWASDGHSVVACVYEAPNLCTDSRRVKVKDMSREKCLANAERSVWCDKEDNFITVRLTIEEFVAESGFKTVISRGVGWSPGGYRFHVLEVK